MTGLPIHLFLHQHPSLPPSLRLSRLPPKARHLRVYHVYTPPDNPPSFLLEKSYRPAASPIHPLAIPLCVFEGEGERERVPSPDPSFERIRTHLFRCQNFSTPTQFVTSRRRACRGAVLVRADEKKRRRTPSTMMIGSVSTSDDDMLMYGYAGDT